MKEQFSFSCSNLLQSIDYRKYHSVQFYFTAAAVLICLLTTLFLLLDLLQVHIYRHDAAYYQGQNAYFVRLVQEGRWVNYLLYPVFSRIPGQLASLLDFLFLFLFLFSVSNRWVKNVPYSLLISLLCIQATPMMSAIMWPATILPAFLILYLSTFFSKRIPVFLFYALFGILLFGSMSLLYYLLPLAHLPLLSHSSVKQNLRVLFLRIIPAWAAGFVAGYLFALLVIYVVSGDVGIQIADWRKPNYIHSLQDLVENVHSSIRHLFNHSTTLFTGSWRNTMFALAFVIGILGVNKSQYLPMAILSLGVIVVHYVLTIPIGIYISYRSVTSFWLGFMMLFFFYPTIKRWQYNSLIPVIVVLTVSFYSVNHETVRWYSSITNTYYDELQRSIPRAASLYKGVAFVSSSEDVNRVTSMLSKKLGVRIGYMENIHQDFRWTPAAKEAGFKNVLLCKNWHAEHKVCKGALRLKDDLEPQEVNSSGLYQFHGQYNDYLIVSLNL